MRNRALRQAQPKIKFLSLILIPRPRFLYSGPRARQGGYHFDWKEAEKTGDTFCRQDHPLAAQLIEQALNRNLPPATLALDYAAHQQEISVLKPLVGSTGWFELSKLTVESLDTEEFIVFAAQTASGHALDEEVLKLDHWSDDLKQGLEREIKELDKQIREASRTTALAASLQDKLDEEVPG